MFATVKQIFNPANKDLQKRILFTLMALFIFKLGTTIVVPIIPKTSLNNLGFLELMNIMNGGGLQNFSIFALGVMPYITASIIMQLLQMDIIPYFAELSKQGYTGRVKLNMYTRIMGIALAFIQGYLFAFNFAGKDALLCVEVATILTAGTAFLLWLGDQVTAKGVGNGISLIIMAGIIASLPTMFYTAYQGMIGDSATFNGIMQFVLFVIVYFGIIVGVVYIETAERRIPIQYANKSAGSLGGNQNYMPFKINSAGVMPVIFASALFSIPSIIAAIMNNQDVTNFVNKYINYSTPMGFIVYVLIIIAFAYFYTFLQLKPKELVENLQKNGGYIPGVRPGDETLKYVKTILNRLTIVGALALAALVGIPILFGLISNLGASVTLGGTGVIIVVGVALETYKQIESQLASHDYVRGRGRRRR